MVAGTATEIGKTWVTARVAARLRSAGHTVAARKPVQSFDPADDHPTDAEVLAEATGEATTRVCGDERSYPVALAPPMAAELLGRPCPPVADLVPVDWPAGTAIGFVELVGGVRSPIGSDGDGVDLTHLVEPDLAVLVADAGLGTINAVRLSAAALEPHPVIVHLNRFDPDDALHQRNRSWLVDRDGLVVTTTIDELAETCAARLR